MSIQEIDLKVKELHALESKRTRSPTNPDGVVDIIAYTPPQGKKKETLSEHCLERPIWAMIADQELRRPSRYSTDFPLWREI